MKNSQNSFNEEEKALESAAKYGCNQIIPFIWKQLKFCPYSYFPCDTPDCTVVVSRGEFQHDDSTPAQVVGFVLNESFPITLYLNESKTLLLHEEKHGVQLVLIKSSQHSWISMNRVDSDSEGFDIDIEASILVPPEPEPEIDDETRDLFAPVASSDEEIREFLLANGIEVMRLPTRITMKFNSLKLNKNKVEAHLLQLPYIPDNDTMPFNIDISVKEKKNSDL